MLAGTPAVPDLAYDSTAGAMVYPVPGTNAPQVPYVDVSLLTPDGQFNALAQYLEDCDSMNPAPFTGTPPWTEGIEPGEVIPPQILDDQYVVKPDIEAQATQDLQQRVRDAYEPFTFVPDHELDDQYGGLGVPPGPPNLDQPVEYGNTQIVRNNPAACHGDTAWSGRPAVARVARMFNGFPGYNAGTSRGHGIAPLKTTTPLVYFTQQYRDMLISELRNRAPHSVVIADVPSVPWTEQVTPYDPTQMATESPIGAEGVLPW